MPTVSVIIPTYRHRDYVRATLDSVFAQTFADYEIIVINDGSPDDTAAVLRPLVEAGKIKYVEQANAGQASARNLGLAMAAGEFVAYLDDDDLWPPDKLAWQVDVLRATDAVAVGGLARTLKDGVLETVVETNDRTPLRINDVFGRNPFFSPGQFLIRTADVRAIGGFDPAIWGSDDLDLVMRLVGRGRFWLVGRVALHYRLHATNASHAWERMLVNTRRTMTKNVDLVPSADRDALVRQGQRSLYFYVGSPQVQGVWSLSPAKWRDAARAIGHFLRPAARQPWFLFAFARDLTPAWIRRMLHPKP